MDNNWVLNLKRAYILNFPVDLINQHEAVEASKKYLDEKKYLQIVTLNPEMIIQAQKLPDLSSTITNAGLIIPDGVGIILALLFQGIFMPKTTPGIELSENLISYCSEKNYSVAFFGASKEVNEMMLENLKMKYSSLNIAFIHDGYFKDEEEEFFAIEMSKTKPSLALIALGVPKQELWIKKYSDLFPETVMVGVGGSFDVWSGKVKRAPKIFRALKIEWLYRLVSQPFRAQRILTSLPLFLIRVIIARISSKI